MGLGFVRVTHVHKPSVAVAQPDEEVGDVIAESSALCILRALGPQDRQRLGGDAHDIGVMVCAQEVLPLQQALEPGVSLHRGGPPQSLVVALARQAKNSRMGRASSKGSAVSDRLASTLSNRPSRRASTRTVSVTLLGKECSARLTEPPGLLALDS